MIPIHILSSSRYPLPEKPRQKRAVIQDMVRPLKLWLLRHRHNPYPTKAEKVQLALGSNMTLVQVNHYLMDTLFRSNLTKLINLTTIQTINNFRIILGVKLVRKCTKEVKKCCSGAKMQLVQTTQTLQSICARKCRAALDILE